jgi:hypothetical protein
MTQWASVYDPCSALMWVRWNALPVELTHLSPRDYLHSKWEETPRHAINLFNWNSLGAELFAEFPVSTFALVYSDIFRGAVSDRVNTRDIWVSRIQIFTLHRVECYIRCLHTQRLFGTLRKQKVCMVIFKNICLIYYTSFI